MEKPSCLIQMMVEIAFNIFEKETKMEKKVSMTIKLLICCLSAKSFLLDSLLVVFD